MKIQRFIFGMFDGKIGQAKTRNVTKLLTDENFQYLRDLTEPPPNDYLWLPTEQIVAFPKIVKVSDENGRDFIQNETWLIPIHDYIKLTKEQLSKIQQQKYDLKELPLVLEPVEIL